MTHDTNSAVAESLVGCCIDERYQLEAEIGVGGLGSVYRALHTKLQRAVAVKLLHESYGSDALQRRRFEREAKALAALEHPNIVAILDYGVSETRPYLVMELLEGETLAQRLKRGQIAVKPALSIAQQLLEALSFMHNAGLVHRDVKPSNVFLQRMPNGRERVKVLDFGLAKFTAPAIAGSDPTLTRDGTIVGTPAYMSPEQATGDMVDARGDVYAVGVILFQMLAGKLPFEGDAIQLIRSHLVATVPTLENLRSDVANTGTLDALIQRAMAKQREERFADAGEMLLTLLNAAAGGADTTSKERDSLATALADVDPLTGELVIALDDSNDAPTAVRSARPAFGVLSRFAMWLRGLAGRLWLMGVRVVATVSVLLVLSAIAIVMLLSRNDADRADLVALQRRVSDRLAERSFRSQTMRQTTRQTTQQTTQPPASEAGKHTPSVGPNAKQTTGDSRAGSTQAADLHASVLAVPPTAATNVEPGSATTVTTVAAAAPQPQSGATEPATGLIVAVDSTAASGVMPSSEPLALGAHAVVIVPPTIGEPNAPANAPSQTGLAPPPMAANLPDLHAPDVPGPPAARDPWLSGAPRELRMLRKLVGSGGRAGERAALALRAYNQEHTDDARGHLLLGQLYFNRLWRADALVQLALALQLDLSARGAPDVLPMLLELVVQGKTSNQAERLIIKSYGSEASSAVDLAITKQKDPASATRLRALRTRLGS